MTPQEVNSGNFGKVITKKNKDGTLDGNIMEFTDNKYHNDEKGNYIIMFLGFWIEKKIKMGIVCPFCLIIKF